MYELIIHYYSLNIFKNIIKNTEKKVDCLKLKIIQILFYMFTSNQEK